LVPCDLGPRLAGESVQFCSDSTRDPVKLASCRAYWLPPGSDGQARTPADTNGQGPLSPTPLCATKLLQPRYG